VSMSDSVPGLAKEFSATVSRPCLPSSFNPW
jgi:hypothetical protein